MKKLFDEIDKHLIIDKKPSEYIEELFNKGLVKELYPLTMLGALVETPQSPEHHPEGNVWNHTMLVIDQAAKRRDKSKDIRVLMWSALLHDLGKAPTTKLRNGRLTSYDHDKVGKRLSIEFLKVFDCDEEFIKKVSAMVRWHMQNLFVTKNLPFADIKGMLEEVDLEEMAILSISDRLGRGEMTEEKIEGEKRSIEYFVKKCEQYIEVAVD